MATKLTFTFINPDSKQSMLLAEGILGQDVIEADGNYYVSKNAMKVDMNRFQVDKDAYTCPYKGHCDYYDLVDGGEVIKKMATWSYPQPNAGWEQITDKFGFPHSNGMNDIQIEQSEVK